MRLDCSYLNLKVEAGHDLRMFLILRKSEPQCSYKHGSYSTKTCSLIAQRAKDAMKFDHCQSDAEC